MYFDILNRLGVDHECVRQTDGRTDVSIAKAALDYDVHGVQPKNGIDVTLGFLWSHDRLSSAD